MANSNTDFLRFSAYSMKELITRKLTEDSKFTDQVYEGSNLAILIDIFSYIYQCLAYQLNNAAAESMFADTQLYNNMVRLVKFIGYNPRGCIPSQFTGLVTAQMSEQNIRGKRLPPFTYFVTQKNGKNGEPVCFSTNQWYPFESDNIDEGIEVQFYNGRWKIYNTVYTASGIENETFTLDNLKSDSDENKYVSGDFIKIFIGTRYLNDGILSEEYHLDTEWFNDNNGIFTRSNKDQINIGTDNVSTNIYGPLERVYTISLNENKTYEIKFGNGITGKKLMPGDRIYVFYLDSNGKDGEIDLSEINFSEIQLKHDFRQMNSIIPENIIKEIFGNDALNNNGMMYTLFEDSNFNKKIKVSSKSAITTQFKSEESVSDIRNNAPGWFKTGNRLITAKDIEFYIKTYGDSLGLAGIVDVKCMNNMQYVASLYKWLYENGIKSKDVPERISEKTLGVDPGRYYLDNVIFNRSNFKYIDPSDANNTYLWIKTESSIQDEQIIKMQNTINDKLYHLKTITTEYQLVKPVLVKFAICANPNIDDIKNRYFKNTDVNFDADCESYIEITLDDNMIYVSSNIQKLVYDEIIKAFNINSQCLGGIVQYQDIVNNIYAINGVQRVRTIYMKDNYSHIYDGISFASWTEESVLHFYEDLQVGNVMRHVEEFQFPVLENEVGLFDRIKIITKAMHQVHTIKF